MTKKRKHYKPSRLARIEHKCNLILSELLIIRQNLNARKSEVDRTIDHLHESARRLRSQSEKERDAVSRLFKSL